MKCQKYRRPNNRRWASCKRKIRHESEEDAKVTQADVLANQKVKLRVYKCRFCRGYHLGNRSKPKYRYRFR